MSALDRAIMETERALRALKAHRDIESKRQHKGYASRDCAAAKRVTIDAQFASTCPRCLYLLTDFGACMKCNWTPSSPDPVGVHLKLYDSREIALLSDDAKRFAKDRDDLRKQLEGMKRMAKQGA